MLQHQNANPGPQSDDKVNQFFAKIWKHISNDLDALETVCFLLILEPSTDSEDIRVTPVSVMLQLCTSSLFVLPQTKNLYTTATEL